MERTKVILGLRIAASAVCGVMCVLLVLLWCGVIGISTVCALGNEMRSRLSEVAFSSMRFSTSIVSDRNCLFQREFFSRQV